jgi:ribosomal protein S20
MTKKKLTESKRLQLKEGLFDSMWKIISKGAGKKLISKFKGDSELQTAIKRTDKAHLELEDAKEILRKASADYAETVKKWTT